MNDKSFLSRVYDKTISLLEASYWERPFRWLTFLALSLLVLVSVYLFLHTKRGYDLQNLYGWETIQLHPGRVQTLNYIFLNRSVSPQSAAAATPTEKDAAAPPGAKETTLGASTTVIDVHQPLGKDQIELAGEYLTNELGSGIFSTADLKLPDDKENPTKDKTKLPAKKSAVPNLGSLDTLQLRHIKNILQRLPAEVCAGFLLEQRFRVRSYFWLTGGPAYWEVIFWSMFGVLASLLYGVSTASRDDTETGYKNSDVAYQFTKLLYAPLAILVTVFAYHILQGNNESMVDIEAGKEMLFFSFIAGFYSGRLMSFLERIKEILLPFDDTAKPTVGKEMPRALSIEDVSAVVSVDPTKVSAEQLSDINEKFLDRTNITLTKDGTEQQRFEKLEGDQEGQFVARNILPGSYVLKAFLTLPVTEQGDEEPNTDPTEFSFEKTILIGNDASSRKLTIVLTPDESQG